MVPKAYEKDHGIMKIGLSRPSKPRVSSEPPGFAPKSSRRRCFLSENLHLIKDEDTLQQLAIIAAIQLLRSCLADASHQFSPRISRYGTSTVSSLYQEDLVLSRFTATADFTSDDAETALSPGQWQASTVRKRDRGAYASGTGYDGSAAPYTRPSLGLDDFDTAPAPGGIRVS